MKKILFVALILVAGISVANAQNMSSSYKTALGAKGYFGDGSIGGFNVKHFFNSTNALEGSLLFRSHFVAFEGIYEWHGPINGAKGLKWYVGPGAQLGFYTGDHDHDYNNDHHDDNVLFALKGTVGLDYKFTGAPIDIAFDVNPTFNLTPNTDFNFYAGLAFRFAL
ncbi:hypothetical protein QTN47_05960 [Danxiaibacter flavus]|uniref:Outer membrane protein beta-barrel domain-containing protein n=1 Tax=Danxiaibacter flavus TaxID=3049108 RepID=A0ABV3ZB11_9BACT|nr:hypothetical protein QNM32_05960 [Chitinophagaceae bacterium DXS]